MSRRTHYVSTQQGATLVDVALAVSIAGILLSIGLATWTGSIRERRVSKVAEEIAALAVQHASRDEIARAATENGMRPMWDDGLEKVASGLTSIEELARILS